MISVSYLILLNKTSTHVRDFGIRESLFVDSRIQEIFAVESGIQFKESGIH